MSCPRRRSRSGFSRDQRLDLGTSSGVQAERELGVDELLARRGGAAPRAARPRRRRTARTRRPRAAARARAPAPRAAFGAPARHGALRRLLHQALEPHEVESSRARSELVARRAGATSVSGPSARRSWETKFWSDALALAGGPLPQVVDQAVGGDDLALAQEEPREQRAVLLPRQLDHTVALPDLERAEDAELHLPLVPPLGRQLPPGDYRRGEAPRRKRRRSAGESGRARRSTLRRAIATRSATLPQTLHA